ncbi:hypothetical protein [Streptomyces sp. enrichment culture]|uniref:hypothetical protein n=1 Tax=Streptomyces sp. enrichment culture TaxID=1795815 RepID=UPI003F56257E
MSWSLFAALLAGAVVAAAAVGLRPSALRPPGTRTPRFRDTRRLARRLLGVTAALGLAGLLSWALMLLPPVNDAVLGDLPRDLDDFARLCEDGSGESGEPFPRAASYRPQDPEDRSRPWVAVEDDRAAHASSGTVPEEPVDRDHEPSPESVQLVMCSKVSGSVPGTEISCSYTNGPLGYGPVTQTVEFARGRYTVDVFEARNGERVATRTLRGDSEVQCARLVTAGESEPRYTTPGWQAYAQLAADLPSPRPDGAT